MKAFFSLYKSAFGGLSPAAWMLALVILINRSGTMVIPFLSVYLTSSLGFSLVETGWVMSVFGLGSISGSFLGGWLTDKIGHFKVQAFSLLGSGVMFFALSQVKSFYPLTLFIFFVSVVSEMLRPANQASVASYARPENVTRAFSLNRMAVNLGFSVGPALGGILAAASYTSLFIADGVTCLVAGLVFLLYFGNKEGNRSATKHVSESRPGQSVWRDLPFLGFMFFVVCFASLFFQLFNTWPLYHREVFQLSEKEIGILLGMNGFVVFLFEMILVYKIGERISIQKLVLTGTLLMSLAFVTLWSFHTKAALYLACLLISFAEIFAMPFMATHTVNRSTPKTRGAYLGLYSMGFASAFVLAPLIGTNVIAHFGFKNWWALAAILAVCTATGFYLTLRSKTQPASSKPYHH